MITKSLRISLEVRGTSEAKSQRLHKPSHLLVMCVDEIEPKICGSGEYEVPKVFD